MKIVDVLGPGCYNCHLLEQAALEAIATAGVEATVVKVTDYARIAAYRVMHTPGLVIDGRIVGSWKRVLTKDSAILMLSPFAPLSQAEDQAVARAVGRYSAFLGRSVVLA